MVTAPNRRILHLENGQSEHITVNGVPCRFIRRDLESRTEPTWDIA